MKRIAPASIDARPDPVWRGRPSRSSVLQYLDGAAVGAVALAWSAAALDQRPGISGMLDQLSQLDRSLIWSEWWGLPLLDGAIGLGVFLGGAASARRAERGDGLIRFAAHVSRSVGWIGVFVAVVSAGAVTATGLNPAAAHRGSSGSWLVLLVLLSAGVALAEGSIVARSRSMLFGAGREPSGNLPLAEATVAGLGVLVLGAGVHGFVPVVVTRLALQVVGFMAGARHRTQR